MSQEIDPAMRLLTCLLLLTALAPAPVVAAEPPIAAAFKASEAARKLAALGTELLFVAPLEDGWALVGYYQPELGEYNEWDDETRLAVYAPDGAGFKVRQFLTKGGKSPYGRLKAWATRDLDGDGLVEIIAISPPTRFNHRVRSVVFRRAAQDVNFKPAWEHDDRGAAFSLDGKTLSYTYEERKPGHPRVFETYTLDGESYRRVEGGH